MKNLSISKPAILTTGLVLATGVALATGNNAQAADTTTPTDKDTKQETKSEVKKVTKEEIKTAKDEVSSLDTKVQDQKDTVTKSQDKVTTAKTDVTNYETKKEELQKVDTSDKAKETVKSNIKTSEDKLIKTNEDLTSAKETLKEKQDEQAKVNVKVEEKQKELDVAKSETTKQSEKVAEVKKDLANTSVGELKAKETNLVSDVEKLDKDLAMSKTKLEKSIVEDTKTAETIKTTEKTIADKTTEKQPLTSSIENISKSISEKEKELSTMIDVPQSILIDKSWIEDFKNFYTYYKVTIREEGRKFREQYEKEHGTAFTPEYKKAWEENDKKLYAERDRLENIVKANKNRNPLNLVRASGSDYDRVLPGEKLYKINDLPQEVKDELGQYTARLINSFKAQLGMKQDAVYNTKVQQFADELGKAYLAREDFNTLKKQGHDFDAIRNANKAMKELDSRLINKQGNNNFSENLLTNPNYVKPEMTLRQLYINVYEAIAYFTVWDDVEDYNHTITMLENPETAINFRQYESKRKGARNMLEGTEFEHKLDPEYYYANDKQGAGFQISQVFYWNLAPYNKKLNDVDKYIMSFDKEKQEVKDPSVIKEEIKNLKTKLSSEQTKHDTITSNIAKLNATLAELKAKPSDTPKLKEEINALTTTLADKNKELTATREGIKNISKVIEEKRNVLKAEEKVLSDLQEVEKAKLNELDKAKLNYAFAEKETLNAKTNVTELETMLSTLTKNLNAYKEQLSTIENQKQKLEQLELSLTQAKNVLTKVQDENKEEVAKLDVLVKEYEQAVKHYNELVARYNVENPTLKPIPLKPIKPTDDVKQNNKITKVTDSVEKKLSNTGQTTTNTLVTSLLILAVAAAIRRRQQRN